MWSPPLVIGDIRELALGSASALRGAPTITSGTIRPTLLIVGPRYSAVIVSGDTIFEQRLVTAPTATVRTSPSRSCLRRNAAGWPVPASQPPAMLTGNIFRGFHRSCHDVPSASIVRSFDAPSSSGSHRGCRCIGERGKHEITCADRAFGAQFESCRDDVAAPHDRYISRRCTSKARHSSAKSRGRVRERPVRCSMRCIR
jgi:hypothetical protein